MLLLKLIQIHLYIYIYTAEKCVSVFNGESSIEGKRNLSALININNSESLDLKNSFTIEAAIFPKGWGPKQYGEGRILSKGGIEVFLNSKKSLKRKPESLIVSITDSMNNTVLFSTMDSTIKLNKWQHLALVIDSNKISALYINGRYEPLVIISGVNTSIKLKSTVGEKLQILNSSDGSCTFEGMIDEVKVWQSKKSREEINEWMNKYADTMDVNLVLYYQMNEGDGSIINNKRNKIFYGLLNNCKWNKGVDFSEIMEIEEVSNLRLNQQNEIMINTYPNPFNPTATIEIQAGENNRMDMSKVEVFDITGKFIECIYYGQIKEGKLKILWNAKDRASGIYFVRASLGNSATIKKIILIK